jgi:hypothetical protein
MSSVKVPKAPAGYNRCAGANYANSGFLQRPPKSAATNNVASEDLTRALARNGRVTVTPRLNHSLRSHGCLCPIDAHAGRVRLETKRADAKSTAQHHDLTEGPLVVAHVGNWNAQ